MTFKMAAGCHLEYRKSFHANICLTAKSVEDVSNHGRDIIIAYDLKIFSMAGSTLK